MGKSMWMFLGMTLLIQLHAGRCAVSTEANDTDAAPLSSQGAEKSFAALKTVKTSWKVNATVISRKKTESEKPAPINPDRPQPPKSVIYANDFVPDSKKSGTNNDNWQPERSQMAPAKSGRTEDRHDDDFWKDGKGNPRAVIIAETETSDKVLSSSGVNQEERKPVVHHRHYYLRRPKRELSDDLYLHRSKRFMIPIGSSKKKSNFLDNFRKRVNAIQSNRDKMKASGSHGMNLNFPFLGSNQNAFSNLRNSLKRIGDKIGKDINWKKSMVGDDPNAVNNKRVTCGNATCHPKAVCYRSKCRCQRGLTGDGVNTCEKMCKCTVSGDPHFHTFDGEIIHLMGDCKYTLSGSIKFNDSCNFRINVQNERRGSNKMVSWPKYIDFHIYNQTIRLGPHENVFVNGEAKTLPLARLGGKIEVFYASSYLQVTTKCGIQLSFNGKTIAKLLVPDKYSSRLTGLCGDCNGQKDDLRTRQGEDVSKEKNKYSKIGSSYIINDGHTTDEKQCNTQDLEAKCSKEMKAVFSTSDYCGIITDPNSIFGDCVAADRESAQQYFESCMFDVCANQVDNDTALCDNIEVFSLQCRDMGFTVDWRDEDFCPIKCEESMHYSPEVSGCPASCKEPEAPSTCTLPSNEGCQCDDGMLLNGKSCTYISMCGCFDEHGDYTSLGEEKMTDDCSQVLKCTKKGDHPELELYKQLKCHAAAQCVVVDNGERMCKCNPGYVGDGYASCERGDKKNPNSKLEERPQGDASYMNQKTPERTECGQLSCHPHATCHNGRCVCKPGLYGDGVKMCNDVCVCSAKGDPHYRTYDGEMISFMGPCRYLLTGTTPKATTCQFRVFVTNEKRGGIGEVTWTKQVDIYIYKLHIRIDSSRKVYVNDEVRYLPSSELDGKVRLFRTGNHAVVSTECGLQVGFDGMHIVKVVAPSKLSQMMTGICGDCDGIKNDIRLKNGTDVSKMPGASTLVANSYRDPLDSNKGPSQNCYAHPVNSECHDDEIVQEYCSIIRNRTGPFRTCIEAIPHIAEEYYETCRIDVCSYKRNVFMIDEVGCDAVSAMADACEEHGIAVNWRSSKFCPVICPSVNTTYSYRTTGCPATCVEPNGPKSCTEPDKEGCQCLPGLLLSDDICVEPSRCGCKTPTGSYLPVGAKQISSDCQHVIICERINGKAHLTTTENKKCGIQASCVLESVGVYHCKCNTGYDGDPHVKCTKSAQYVGLLQTENKCAKCHPNTECLDGRCVCKPGFIRDLYNVCEDKCFCAVSGDLHYMTFDGQLINYQGSCSYLLSQSHVPGDPCGFKIYIENKLTQENPRTVVPERVHVTIYGHNYTISRNESYVDGQLKIPLIMDDKVTIFRNRDLNGLSTKCGIRVYVSTSNIFHVLIPRSYSQKMTGICGDCNKIHDDFRHSNGANVANDPRRNNLVGDSYILPTVSDHRNCRGPKSIPCSKPNHSSAKSPNRCGLMKDAQGPFSQCIANAPDLANQFFDACSLDLCVHGSNLDIICKKLDAFADICLTLEFPAKWRNEIACPIPKPLDPVMISMMADMPHKCPKCHQRASCKYNKCVCHDGLFGDGVNSCEKQCVCRATGDPHYATYDGAWFNFMGACRYLLTQRLQAGRCNFRITAKNGYRKELRGTRILWIELDIFGKLYRIEKPEHKILPRLLINNVTKEIGQKYGDQVTANRYGHHGIILKTPCDMTVSFDGVTAVISVRQHSAPLLRGMCGDCDGNKENDLPTGSSLMAKDHMVYGDTWRIPDPSDEPGKTCKGRSPKKCTADQERFVRLNKNCGYLLDPTGPFKECLQNLGIIMNEQFMHCKMEFCMLGASQREITCPKLELAASICAAHGFAVKWRTESFCPPICSENKQYLPFDYGCQPTCGNPNAEAQCTLSPLENCVCEKGFVLNEATNECVKKCPGKHFDRAFADSQESEVASQNKCGWYTCAANAACKNVKGELKCMCRDGFAGNGIDVCDKAHCACSASGDPHYMTFDSTSLYLLGDCKYTMARSVGISKCLFTVEVKNEHRMYSKFPSRAFTRLVDVKIDGHVYQLHLYKKLKVDGKWRPMPYKNPTGTVSVAMEGKFMKLETQCDLKVRFDGVHAVIITLPQLYAGKMEGICGNCDGNARNDLMSGKRDLSRIANKTEAYEEFARQYLVVDDSDRPARDRICRVK